MYGKCKCLVGALWLALAFVVWPASALTIESATTGDPVAKRWIESHLPTEVKLQYPEIVTEIYSQWRLRPVWESTEARTSLEQQINVVALAEISQWMEERAYLLAQLKVSGNWRAYDIVATDSALAYVRYQRDLQADGKVSLFGAGVRTALRDPDVIDVENFLAAIHGGHLTTWIEMKKPAADSYNQMLTAILALQELDTSLLPIVNYSGVIRPGDVIDISPLVRRLVAFGDLHPDDATALTQDLAVTYYHPTLVTAVKRFQARHGLSEDGAIGPKTLKWINTSVDEKVRLMALNMERLRLWHQQRDNMLVVNIPGYGLQLWQDQTLAFESKVIVGRPSRPTPLLYSELDTVVFNPSWNVPDSIMEKDIIPKVKRDSSYLVNNNYRILESWRSSNVIAPESIDWSTISPSNFPYRLQQSPGNHNALGRYKFNMPNDDAIYLHDTPSKGLFGRSQRAFSSGCVRVEQSHSLAMWLMDRAGVNQSRAEGYRKAGSTKFVNVRNRVPVEIIYQTAWVNTHNGELQFRTDIYDYDHKRSWPFDEDLLTALGI